MSQVVSATSSQENKRNNSLSRIKVSQGCLGEEELGAVRQVFATGYFGLSDKVFEFEAALKQYLGAEHVVATCTGTAALHLALDALGVNDGDEVIVPSLTYVASFQAISATGATPVPCEVNPETLLMELADVERRITPRTRVVMPVHYSGMPCEMDALLKLAERRGLRVVEDAAHAFGSSYRGRRVGSFGDVASFSFDSIKNITCGEGGAAVCRDAKLAERMRQKRSLGIDRRQNRNAPDRSGGFEVITQGFRYHMGSINAAIGLVQLGRIESFLAHRREICRRYDRAFEKLQGIQPLFRDYAEIAPYNYVVRVQHGRRDELLQFLSERGIETAINYLPNHLHPYYRQSDARLGVTEKIYEEILTLPLHCALSDADVEEVIDGVREFLAAEIKV
jgi:perosamine synthetase